MEGRALARAGTGFVVRSAARSKLRPYKNGFRYSLSLRFWTAFGDSRAGLHSYQTLPLEKICKLRREPL